MPRATNTGITQTVQLVKAAQGKMASTQQMDRVVICADELDTKAQLRGLIMVSGLRHGDAAVAGCTPTAHAGCGRH